MSFLLPGGTSSFKFARPVFVSNGLYDGLDAYAKKLITELSAKLSRKFLNEEFEFKYVQQAEITKRPLEEAIVDWIDHVPKSAADLKSFGELIDQKGDTALFYEVQEYVSTNKLSFNANRLLKDRPVLEFLFCVAKYAKRLNSSAAIFKYVANEVDGGIKAIYDYVVHKTILQVVDDNKIEVGHMPTFEALVIPKLQSRNISFAEGVFSKELKNAIQKFVYDQKELELINAVRDALNIEEEDIPALVAYIKKSKITIDKDNAQYYLSIALAQIRNNSLNYPFSATDTTAVDAEDFSVTYYDDDKSTLQIEKENIMCAAQLFYVMTLGDELEIFNVIDLITTKYLPAGKLDIRDRNVLQDLQLYVLSDNIRDVKTNAIYKRTNPEDRRVFYRQVFDMGNSETADGMVTNSDFKTLWEILLNETVKYIGKVEQSENPQLYVSRQNIFQAIEDLQYNLSTNCTGMAKVMAPIINKELDFVVERFLKKEDITRQLAFNNSGSFWKVIERVLRDARGETPNVAALRNKAVFGHKILTMIANYTPATLNDDTNFSDFVATVEAFIIAASQLENRGAELPDRDELHQHDELQHTANGNGTAKEDWNF